MARDQGKWRNKETVGKFEASLVAVNRNTLISY